MSRVRELPGWSAPGEPPDVLLAGGPDDLVKAPSGGPPMLMLRGRAEVPQLLASPAAVMANRACPLTGAEAQKYWGLLVMNGRKHAAIRQVINALFSPAAAAATVPAARAAAADYLARLARAQDADLIADYAEPFTARLVCATLGRPLSDWDYIKLAGQIAFGMVASPTAVAEVKAMWEELYRYYRPIVQQALAHPVPDCLVRDIALRLRAAGYETTAIVRVVATVSNGFQAILPVLARVLAELLRDPATVAACLRGALDWAEVITRLIGTVAMFPVNLPRLLTRDLRLGNRVIPAGTQLLPSLIAAGRAGAPPSIAFGHGPHYCPGAALTQAWVTAAARAFFTAFPHGRLAGPLDWDDGQLPVPRTLKVSLAPAADRPAG